MDQAWGFSYGGCVNDGQLAATASQCIVTLLVKSSQCVIEWQPRHSTLTMLLTSACITTQINLIGEIWNKTAFPTKSLKHRRFRWMPFSCIVHLYWACSLPLPHFPSYRAPYGLDVFEDVFKSLTCWTTNARWTLITAYVKLMCFLVFIALWKSSPWP